jgi:protein-S-isoprenylcysteine O-methyltransferase Ste14
MALRCEATPAPISAFGHENDTNMRLIHRIAGFVLAGEMPVPVYWLVLHAGVSFWRRHVRAGYWVAVLMAWGGGDWLLYHFRGVLFPPQQRPLAAVIAGLALIAADLIMFVTAETVLGGRRLVGHAELTGRGEIATRGLYTRLRHPRYLGMMAAILGACVLAGSWTLWVLAACWWIVAMATIWLEERELRRRFGSAYDDYARRVPALLPFHFGSGR